MYSIELLQAIIGLWITIRGHSFAKDWTMKFETKYKKGTRKALQEMRDNHKMDISLKISISTFVLCTVIVINVGVDAYAYEGVAKLHVIGVPLD